MLLSDFLWLFHMKETSFFRWIDGIQATAKSISYEIACYQYLPMWLDENLNFSNFYLAFELMN